MSLETLYLSIFFLDDVFNFHFNFRDVHEIITFLMSVIQSSRNSIYGSWSKYWVIKGLLR